MNKNLGSSAGLVALGAFLLHVATSPSEKRSDANAPKAERQTASAPAKLSNTEPEPVIEGPWLAAQTFFHTEPEKPVCRPSRVATASASGCEALPLSNVNEIEACSFDKTCSVQLQNYFGLSADYRPQFLIASVPDPLHTRLSLFTDGSLNAIEQAAFDSHWEFASQWLPWYDSTNPADRDPSSRRKQRLAVRLQEEQPGILIFRHGLEGTVFDRKILLVFLVGETPTAGLNASQYREARAYMRAFGDPADIRIAGPTFSGSFFSLGQLINEDQATVAKKQNATSEPAAKTYQYWVRSGAATVRSFAEAFVAETRNTNFRATSEDNTDEDRHFRQILRDLRIQPREAAVLVEDESAYSTSYLRGPNSGEQPRRLRFPRDISHLRNIYRDATVESASGKAVQPDVEFSLKDPESGEDSVPIFSTAQTPVSQNAILHEITSQIRREEIRIVELGGTNVLDLLFLAKVLRQQCPDARLLITSPDLLFVEAAQSESLTGMMAISTYPLFFAAKQWTGEHSVTHPNANEEAVY